MTTKMKDPWLDMWNERYRGEEYAYGEAPNEFLVHELAKLSPSAILFPADGEGRNSVYAATQGWITFAFDISEEGQKKAHRLAEKNNVQIDYHVGQLPHLNFQPHQFDVIALIYAHFPANIKSKYHHLLDQYLRPGGTVIFEAFSKNHPEWQAKYPQVGGPSEEAMLFSTDELLHDFGKYEIFRLTEDVIDLEEGKKHFGKGSVIRFVGRKKEE